MRRTKTVFYFLILLFAGAANALERQPGTDYHARREALAKKAGGLVVLMAPLEPLADSNYDFRQDDNFYYLSGMTNAGAAVLISPAVEAKGDAPARPYTEILFLPPRNARMENFTGPKLGGDDPDAPKITGFDRVEEMSKLPEEASKLLAGGRPMIY